MKHYKFTCSIKKEEYTTSNVFVEIFAEGKNQLEAYLNAEMNFKSDYGFDLNKFDNVNIRFVWEDE